MQLLPPQTHKWIYFFGLSVVAVGMPLSEFLMSIGQFIILGNWFLEGGIISKVKCFWKNKMALLVSSLILMHLLGLFYTSDFEYAFKDIRIKAPLLVVPLLVSTSAPLSKQLFNWLMTIFVASVVAGTIISIGIYYGVIRTKNPVTDIRDISIFISHIRFSLLICLSIFILGWYIYAAPSLFMKTGLAAVMIWLIGFLSILNSLTGIIVLGLVTFLLMLYGVIVSKGIILRIVAIAIVMGMLFGVRIYIKSLATLNSSIHYVDKSNMGETTALGNIYLNDTANVQTENGYPVWIYVCFIELEQAWNERSTIDFKGNNRKGDKVMYTLIRYLTSKGLRKDRAAVMLLNEEEIRAIENGIANVNYVGRSGVTIRIMETLWEFEDYKRGANVNGHSAVMRLEFWKAGWNIVRRHPVIGVGTGDIKNAYARQYEEMKSPLDADHRLRSHNQYLSITVAFGIVGLAWFLMTLIYPVILYRMWNDYFYFVFFLIAVLSFLNEDTLETQPGVTFFAFFNALLLFGREK